VLFRSPQAPGQLLLRLAVTSRVGREEACPAGVAHTPARPRSGTLGECQVEEGKRYTDHGGGLRCQCGAQHRGKPPRRGRCRAPHVFPGAMPPEVGHCSWCGRHPAVGRPASSLRRTARSTDPAGLIERPGGCSPGCSPPPGCSGAPPPTTAPRLGRPTSASPESATPRRSCAPRAVGAVSWRGRLPPSGARMDADARVRVHRCRRGHLSTRRSARRASLLAL